MSACGRSARVPVVLAPAPPPVVPAAPAAPAVEPVPIKRTVPEARYDVRASARIARDSAGRKDEQRVESSGLVTIAVVRATDGALRGSGRVDSFSVRSEGAGTSPTTTGVTIRGTTKGVAATTTAADTPQLLTVLFDAVVDAMSSRVVTRPPLANECDRAETGATALAAALLLRVPASVLAGDRWRDSSVSVICRANMPITVRSFHEYVAERFDGSGASMTVLVRRTSTTRLEGAFASAWRTFDLAGTGTGNDEARVDVTTGALLQLDGESTTALQVTDRSRPTSPRVQKLTQTLSVHARAIASARR